MKNVLVTDAQYRAALAVIRSLGKKNIKITAASENNSAIGFHSKYCSKTTLYPNPKLNPKSFLKQLLELVRTNNFECIIPSHTYTFLLLCKYRDVFSDYVRLPPPNFEVFCNAYDKECFLKIAIEKGIPCPKTYFFDDLEEIASNVQQYPIIIKPSKRHGVSIAICNTKSELEEKYVEMTSKYGDCLVQEYIPNGGEFGVYTLFDHNSKPVALTVHKRNRTYHPYGGVSTLRETIKDDTLVRIAFDLLEHITWSGAAMVEFRVDSRDGLPRIMEINPRFWGSLQLSISSGVDFPYLLYKLTMHEEVTPRLHFRKGVRGRWLLGDIAGFPRFSDKLEFIKDFLKFNTNYDILSLTDLAPFFTSIFSPIEGFGDEEPREDYPDIHTSEIIV